MTITLYGLKNCDTCRKALKDLKAAGLEHVFLDMRSDDVTRELVASWAGMVGWEALLNRRGTTWRGLSDADKANVDEARAIDLMAEHRALIKRPVVAFNDTVSIGFPDAVKNRLT